MEILLQELREEREKEEAGWSCSGLQLQQRCLSPDKVALALLAGGMQLCQVRMRLSNLHRNAPAPCGHGFVVSWCGLIYSIRRRSTHCGFVQQGDVLLACRQMQKKLQPVECSARANGHGLADRTPRQQHQGLRKCIYCA